MSRRFVQHLGLSASVLLGALCTGAGLSESANREALVVISREAEPFRKAAQAARDALRERGWVVRIEVLSKRQAAPTGSEAVVAVGTDAARWAAAHAPSGLPVAYCMVSDSSALRDAAGARMTGIVSEVSVSTQMALLRETLPAARRIGVLYSPNSTRSRRAMEALQSAGRGLEIEAVSIGEKEEIGSALDRLVQRRVDVVWTIPDSAVYDSGTIKALLQTTLRARIPVFGFSTSVVRAGALVGVGIDPDDQGRQAAIGVDRLAAEGGLPSVREVPAEFEISVNLIVASHLGVVVPESVIRKSTNVFREE
jgi:putative ABC transport system substrate-binding protein